MKNNPLVSIIIPIYNTEKYLPSCLDSVLAQTHHNLQVLLIDDGSTDNSGKIADKYAKKDSRIKVIHQPNQGQSAARNTGLKHSTGKYISFTDSDDEIKPEFIASLLAHYDGSNASLSVCGIHYKRLNNNSASDVYINPVSPRHHNQSHKAYILSLLAKDGRMYSSVNKLYRSDIAKTLKFDESLNFAEDTKYVLDYLKKAHGEIKFVLEPLYVYNFGTESSTMRTVSTSWQNWRTSYRNLKSWLGSHPNPSEKFWLHLVNMRWRISYLRSRRRAKN